MRTKITSRKFNPLGVNPTKWLLPTNSLNVFDHFVGLALKGLRDFNNIKFNRCVVKTMSNIYDEAFWEKSKRLSYGNGKFEKKILLDLFGLK